VRYQTWLADSSRWDGFAFRPGDIVISTPAKCGTTWLQMICALLVFGDDRLPGPLTELSPWLDIRTESVAHVFTTLAAQRHRRFIKTHTPLDGLPYDERVTYVGVGRDPRDVAISADHHLDNMNREVLMEAVGNAPMPLDAQDRPADPVVRFWRWVEDAAPPDEGLELTLHHLDTFWERRRAANVVLLHYDELKADLDGQMRWLAGRLGIWIGEEAWPRLVSAARFDRMRNRADLLAPQATMPGLWRDPGRFFHHGTSGQWSTLLGPADLDRYWARVRRFAPPDLVAWVHR
jgi:aryl sulfotransferase